MSDDNKNPADQLKELIKIGVNATNTGLRQAQTKFYDFKAPLSSTLQTIEHNGSVAMETSKIVYAKRKQYAPAILGGTAVCTGGYLWLRRGRIAGILGAVVGSGVAYSVVYDQYSMEFENLPNMIFGKKNE